MPEIKAKVIECTNSYLLFWAAPPPDFEPADYPGYNIRLISPGQCRYKDGELIPVGGAHMYYADPRFMAVLREGGVEDE